MTELNVIIEHFEHIKTMRSKVCAIFQDVKQKLLYLNKIYTDIVKLHSHKEYTFGLDSFYFQARLIEVEHDNLDKILNILTNRFYCEYYKLYKIIEEYITREINDVKLNDKFSNKKVFPVYKDLDKNTNYDFSLTIEIQRNIIKYINDLTEYLRIKTIELKDNTKHSKLGINIENIVNYQHFSNALLNERIHMFVRYLEALNKHHTKFINRLFVSSKSMIDAVNDDIMTKHFNNDHSIHTPENEVVAPTIVEPKEMVQTIVEPTIVEPTIVVPTIVESKEMVQTIVEPTIVEPTIVVAPTEMMQTIESSNIELTISDKQPVDLLHRSISDFDLNIS